MSIRQYYDKRHENLDTSFKESSIPLRLSAADVLRCICDEKALSLFKAIALSENDCNSILITKLGLSRKEFYSRMQKLIDVGLVERASGKYHLTLFGNVVFNTQAKVEVAIENFWKLKALDSIMMSEDKTHLPTEEYHILIDRLIENEEIKAILTSYKK